MIAEENCFNDWTGLVTSLLRDASSVGIGIFSTNGTLIYANTAMCYFLDTDKENLLPGNFFVNPEFSFFLNEKDGIVFEGLATIGNYSDISYVLQTKVFRKNDRLLVYAEAGVIDLIEGNKKMSRLNQEVNNLQRQLIKEKRQLQESLAELKETQQMLIHSEKMNALGKLVAGLAHEVNNPISFVYSNLFSTGKYLEEVFETINDYEDKILLYGSAELQNLLGKIRKKRDLDFLEKDILQMVRESKSGIERVKSLVEDLRRFSRLDEADFKQINLVENIRSTISIVNAEIKTKNILFSFTAPEELRLACYPGQLNQAILNVLINAIQAVDHGGTVSLTVKVPDEFVHICIADNGHGIPEEIKNRIFEPFFTTKPVGSGTGLGLSITYKIIHDLHHGKIDIHTSPNGDTVFEFILPKERVP